jgi:hypothetical protein
VNKREKAYGINMVHRGAVTLVQLERASTAMRFSPGGAPAPRTCVEASLTFPLAF